MKTKGKPENKEEWVGEERQRQSRKARWSRQREEINKRQDKGGRDGEGGEGRRDPEKHSS